MTKVQSAPGIPKEKSRTVRLVHGPATIHLPLQGYKQNLRSPRRNHRRSKQVARSFLSGGSASFRLKFSRCCYMWELAVPHLPSHMIDFKGLARDQFYTSS